MAIKQWAGLHLVNLGGRFWNTIRENWYLGFTSFGGPPVHFKMVSASPTPTPPTLHCGAPFSKASRLWPSGGWVNSDSVPRGPQHIGLGKRRMTDGILRQFHDKFVAKLSWIDEQVVRTGFPGFAGMS